MNYKLHCYSFLLLLLLFNPDLSGSNQNYFFLSSKMMVENMTVRLSQDWVYYPGDKKEYSNPNFDDSSWEKIDPALLSEKIPAKGWQKVGWFRLHIKIDSLLMDQTLRIILMQSGDAEIYFDGKFVCSISDWKHPKTIKFGNKTDHVIAVRFTNNAINKFHFAGFPGGFYLSVASLEKIMEYNSYELSRLISQQTFFTAFTLAFGLLHLILFLNYRRYKENLIYSLFLFVYALSLFFDYQSLLSVNFNEQLLYMRLHRGLMPVGSLLSLLFLYYIFQPKLSKQFWIISFLLFITGFFAVMKPNRNFHYLIAAQGLLFIECLRVVISAMRKKMEGVWLIAAGFSILLFFSLYDFLVDIDLIKQIGNIENGYPFGTIGLFIFMSIYIAKSFAKTNLKIIEQERIAKDKEIENRLLEADNERKTRELEDARKLQLSILPQTIPTFDNIEIAAGMRTATEIGGDYYDFHTSDDGTLTIAIGDATGHGMKAGIMVTLVKSMFDSMAHTFFIPDFFNHCTKKIKRMNMGNLYMGMTLVKIKGNKLVVSSAGMPPILIYKKAERSLDEIILKGMPMGAVIDFSYQQERRELASGDTILLMTDGLMELFNERKEMFGYEKVKEIFKESGDKLANEILQNLFNIVEDWKQSNSLDDDITFVIIKMK
ncbi:MAG: SpoIIE family protein phosphatase [Ignavibacteriales bacterium]|nr:SpoIIE family protein phosphatase [Ignavibacteriales bacterium]